MDASTRKLTSSIAELEVILDDCRGLALAKTDQDHTEKLAEAAEMIELALGLLRAEVQLTVVPPDVENPVRGLPSCSIKSCRMAAGAVVAGKQLCGRHASEALRRQRT